MGATTADLNPKTLEGAKRQFVELYGSALVTNTYLRIALALVSLAALGLVGLNVYTVSRYSQVKPLVIRIDDVGRAEAVQYDATSYQPQPPELRYFLTQFIVKHFSRLRATVQREYPESLLFLEPGLADATIGQNEQSRAIETFMARQYSADLEGYLADRKIPFQVRRAQGTAWLDRKHQLEAVDRWFTHSWKKLDNRLRSSITEGIVVFLSLFDDNPAVHRTFCPPRSAYAGPPKPGEPRPLPPLQELLESGHVQVKRRSRRVCVDHPESAGLSRREAC